MKTAPTRSGLENPYKVGDGATLCGFSDREAYTVIGLTPQSITLQRDKAVLLNGVNSGEADALVCHPGGFAGHTEGDQRYSYERDPGGSIIKARMTKRTRKVWTKGAAADGIGYDHVEHASFKSHASVVVPGRHEHYDFNY